MLFSVGIFLNFHFQMHKIHKKALFSRLSLSEIIVLPLVAKFLESKLKHFKNMTYIFVKIFSKLLFRGKWSLAPDVIFPEPVDGF